jgi:hypothetical protein
MVRQAAGLAFTATRTDESRSALQGASTRKMNATSRHKSGGAERFSSVFALVPFCDGIL